jgi:serine/threonine protein kinase
LLLDSNDPNASLKISDFGLASVTSEGEFMSTILGSKDFVGKEYSKNLTDSFLAPEIVSEEKYNSKVDCWSMGVIIYYCLSGDLPFFYAKEEDKFTAIKQCKWEFSSAIWEDVSEEAKDLISRLLVRDPSKRLSCSEILDHEWFGKFA